MYTLNLIRKKEPLIDKIIAWLFVLSGANFYFNWILPTNPQSKNILIRTMWFNKNRTRGYMESPKWRLGMAYMLGGIHLVFAILMATVGSFWTPANILVNLYPIIVQLYIGYRCWKYDKRKREIDLKRFKNKYERSYV